MGHGGATISLFVLCADRRGGVDHYPCLCCWKIVACSERDMAYATILVRFVYFMWSSDSCPHKWDMAVPLSLFVLCAEQRGGVDLYSCLCCRKIVACRERDMAYATIFVLLVCFGSR